MTKMNPEVKAKWLAALRSGEYVQGRRDLRSKDDEFCCLGVLCDLAVKEGVIPEPVLNDYGRYKYGPAGKQWDDAGLPDVVSDWSGGVMVLGERDQVFGEGHRLDLARLNDDGFTFAQIADIIEEEF